MDDKLKVNLNEYLPLRDVVFNTLRDAILKGELKPGERLMEKQLAERMGVSRTPIREAIRKLELEGLVSMVPRKGAEVARITEKDITDVLEIRASLEALAVKLACKKMTPDDLEVLNTSLKEFSAVVEKNQVDKIIQKDVEFHDVIYQSTRNDKLIHILSNLREQIYRYRVEYIRNLTSYKNIVKEHKKIVQYIEEKNTKLAEQAAVEHIENQEKAVIEFIKQNTSTGL